MDIFSSTFCTFKRKYFDKKIFSTIFRQFKIQRKGNWHHIFATATKVYTKLTFILAIFSFLYFLHFIRCLKLRLYWQTQRFSVNIGSPLVQTGQTLLTRATKGYYNNTDRPDMCVHVTIRRISNGAIVKHFDTDIDLIYTRHWSKFWNKLI